MAGIQMSIGSGMTLGIAMVSRIARSEGFGMKVTWDDNEAYVGKLYVAEVTRLVPEGWRDFAKQPSPTTYYEANEAKPWRAWVYYDPDGRAIGKFPTAEEARAAVEAAVLSAIAEGEG